MKKSISTLIVFLFLVLVGSIAIGVNVRRVFADPQVTDLQQKILDRSKQIQALQKEIQQYQDNLDAVGKQKKTLQSAITTIDLSRKKISTDIQLTQNQIAAADLTIQQLENQINLKKLLISQNTEAIGNAIAKTDEIETQSLLELLLSQDSVSDMWDSLESLTEFKDSVRLKIQELAATKQSYEADQAQRTGKKIELTHLAGQLSDQKTILDQNRTEKNQLLTKTKNQESSYQKMLAEKKAAQEQFQKELSDYESQLKFVLDKSTIPTTGSSAFSWPFEASYMADCPSFSSILGNAQCITQYFGDTQFSRSGAYNGKGHNGVDFRAPPGTKLLSVLAGTVVGTGNTDAFSGCYSYGKWVLIQHNNGLSTLYAHLSLIGVSAGEHVSTGQVIGYSGATGYVTGPHLHLGTFASGGVKIQRLGDIPGRPITACSGASMPVAAYSATLNALDYLPK